MKHPDSGLIYHQFIREEPMLGQHTEVAYEVPGGDIINKLTQRADAADRVVAEFRRTNDGKPPENSCERGVFDAAQRDAETFRLRAKYLDRGKTYHLGAGTLEDIFVVVTQANTGPAQAERAMVERRW